MVEVHSFLHARGVASGEGKGKGEGEGQRVVWMLGVRSVTFLKCHRLTPHHKCRYWQNQPNFWTDMQPPCSLTHSCTHAPTHPRTHAPTHPHTHTPIHPSPIHARDRCLQNPPEMKPRPCQKRRTCISQLELTMVRGEST